MPQPVAAGLDPVVGHVGAVDEDGLAEDAVGRRAAVGEGVGELVVAVEAAVGDHQRQVAVAAAAAAARPRSRRRRSTSRPAPSSCAGRCGRGGGRGTTGRRRVRGARPRSGRRRRFCRAPGSSRNSLPDSRAERPLGMLAEEGDRLALGQAAGLAVELGAVVAAVEVDRELPHLLRQLVVEGDAGALAGAAADRRPREAAAEGPELRLGGRGGSAARPRGSGSGCGLRRGPAGSAAARGTGPRRAPRGGSRRDRQQAAAPAPQGQEDGEGAAAEGAEESSAPEAVRDLRAAQPCR